MIDKIAVFHNWKAENAKKEKVRKIVLCDEEVEVVSNDDALMNIFGVGKNN
jgi:hypothetical protein